MRSTAPAANWSPALSTGLSPHKIWPARIRARARSREGASPCSKTATSARNFVGRGGVSSWPDRSDSGAPLPESTDSLSLRPTDQEYAGSPQFTVANRIALSTIPEPGLPGDGAVAQLGERQNRTLEAVSSILISSTKTAKKPLISGAFLLSR